MPSVVPALGRAASMHPQCRGWQIPFPRALCSPYIPRSFQYGDILLSQQRRDWSPSHYFCCVHWLENLLWRLGRQMRGVSKLCLQHTHAMHRENKEIDGAGWSLLWLMGIPKYKANHNGCCKTHFLEQRFFWFKFLYLFVVYRGLGGGSVCGFVLFFSPLVFLLLKHTEGTFVYSIINKRIVCTL